MANTISVYGIDFTSSPSRSKPIICLESRLVGDVLEIKRFHSWRDFNGFERFLEGSTASPPWIVGIDFPFGMPLRFIRSIGWPVSWDQYIDQHVTRLNRMEWETTLRRDKCAREAGDKEYLRCTDEVAGSKSPQKLANPPVGLMFYEGATRLRRAGVTIPGLQGGCPERIVVEVYPSVAARSMVGHLTYKRSKRKAQVVPSLTARKLILERLLGGGAQRVYGVKVRNTANLDFVQDDTGDRLDALLCGVQAAWAWRNGPPNYGLPTPISPTEGWIADPGVLGTSLADG